jgi:hypothetical protein
MNKTSILLLVLSILMLCSNADATGTPYQVQHQEPTFIERHTPFELTFTVPGIDARDVEEAYVFYRVDGEMAYAQKRAALMSSDFNVELLVDDEQATGMEYYFEIHLNNGKKVTYPQNEASSEPIRVEVIDQRKTERQRRVEQTGVDYTILSPDPGNTVSQQDVVVALTLFYDPAEVDTANTSFQLLLNGEDVTERASASDYFYTYSPDNLPGGEHRATFRLQKPDTALTITQWNFTVLDPDRPDRTTSSAANTQENWIPEGSVEISARNQQVGGFSNDALSGNLRLSGQKDNISYSAHGLLTTQADPRLQPQNRFGARFYVGDWLELEAGHVYPMLNPMTIAGQRMQGVNAGFHFWDDVLNVQVIYGKLRRGIDNIYESIDVEQQTFQGGSGSVTTNDYSLDAQESGTHRRKVAGGRIGIGTGERFNFGLNFLKVEDDTTSINNIDDFGTLMNTNPQLASDLTAQQRQYLQQNPEDLSVSGNPSPKGNFVASTDLEARFDDNRIQFQMDAAASLLNQDIRGGVLTQESAENLGLSINSGTADLLDRLSWLIVFNENLETMPLRYNAGGGSGTTSNLFFPTSILATNSELALNYFDNNLRVQYRWVGPGYNSLANTTIRQDVAGFNISDRFRLLENQIYITLGYENLRDNVVNDQDATTHTVTYRTNISWYPIDQNLPRVSLGLMKRNRDNEVGLNNPIVSGLGGISESAAVQNIRIQNGDTLRTPSPRYSDTYQLTASVSQEFSLFGLTHDASVSYSLLNTFDDVFKYGDSNSNSVSLRVVNRYPDLPLQTNVGFNYNSTESSSGLTDIQIIGLTLGGNAFLFDDKLRVDMSLAFTKNRSVTKGLITNQNGTPQQRSDDYYVPGSSSISESNSYIAAAGARYNLNARHAFHLDFRYSNIRNVLSTSRTIPNDHLLQARYIFNF